MDTQRRSLIAGMAGITALSAAVAGTPAAGQSASPAKGRRKGGAKRIAVYPPERKIFDSENYAAAIRSGDFLFLSGSIGNRPDGSPEPDFAKQVDLAFQHVADTLRAGECTFDDVIDVTTFHTDPEKQIQVVLEARNKWFGGAPFTNWTAVGVTWLSGFAFEIKVIARIPNTGEGQRPR